MNEAKPISLTMPLREEVYRSNVLFPFFDGLIPEGWLLDVALRNTDISILDRMSLKGMHWHAKAVEFWDVTDWNDNLVAERDIISYRKNSYRGNLLFMQDGIDGSGLFFLKEAPCSSVQLEYGGADFIADFGTFSVTGPGINSRDIGPDSWTGIYSVVTGVWSGGELEALTALRKYQKNVRRHLPERDEMIMMNTWGDRSQDSKVNEEFCLAELEKASRLGITHFQIDDGWQVGKSPNSAVAKGSFKNIWDNPDYWTPDPVKYPRGLKPVVDRAKELGIEVGLWFNPSIQNDFEDWRKDADALIRLYREYGIRIFKIDGLNIPNKTAENNLRRFFDAVSEATGRQVVFNLDVTAGRRGGYHYFNEYGNIFLENRYTDWGNYYPYHTLRNVWLLSKYVPAEKLQVEFLNKWRNADKYAGDPFLGGADFDALFAKYIERKYRNKSDTPLINSDKEKVRRRFYLRLNAIAEETKTHLSATNSYNPDLSAFGVNSEDDEDEDEEDSGLQITRAELEECIKSLIDRSIEIMEGCIADCGLTVHDIDRVVLIGGSSRLKIVEQRLETIFGKAKLSGAVNPDEAVACGACQSLVEPLQLKDRIVYSLGQRLKGGRIQCLIPRQTQIKFTSQTLATQPSEDYTTYVCAAIYQGNAEKVRDIEPQSNCDLIEDYRISGYDKTEKVNVTFLTTYTIDEWGIINVTQKYKEKNQILLDTMFRWREPVNFIPPPEEF